jgi:hypothetical protein
LGVDVRTDDDGREQLKFWKATDMVMINGRLQPCVDTLERSRAMTTDQTARRWEVSTAGIAALLKELPSSTEQLIAEQVAAAIAGLPAPKDGIDSEAVKRLIDEKLSAAVKVSQRRKPGPKTQWRLIVAGAARDYYREHKRYPTPEEVVGRCQNELKDLLPKDRDVLDDGSVYQLLRFLGAE